MSTVKFSEVKGNEQPAVEEPEFILKELKLPPCFDNHLDEKVLLEKWTLVKNGIVEVQTKKLTTVDFIELYDLVFSLMQNKKAKMMYDEATELVGSHLESNVRVEVMTSLNKDNFADTLANCWKHHQTAMTIISGILLQLDMLYVPESKNEKVFETGVILFRDRVLLHGAIKDTAKEALLTMVSKERKGDTVNRQVSKRICNMLADLGMKDKSTFYESFEVEFLRQSTDFYRGEAQRYLIGNNATSYVANVDSLLKQEHQRVKDSLHEMTEAKFLKVADAELIIAHTKAVLEMKNGGVLNLLENEKIENLQLMYLIFRRDPDGVESMVKLASPYFRGLGKILAASTDTRIFIQSQLDLKARMDNFLVKSFADDVRVKKMIGDDFDSFLNSNIRAPEFVARFLDDKLRTAAKGTPSKDFETVLDKIVDLFRLLQEKDRFELYFKQHLAVRLLNTTVAEEAEKMAISKLKSDCGSQYTLKLEGMIKDISQSGVLQEEFCKHIAHIGVSLGLDFTVKVLNGNIWPTQAIYRCSVSIEAAAAFDTFRQFYLETHPKQKLTLLPQLGYAEVYAVYNVVKSAKTGAPGRKPSVKGLSPASVKAQPDGSYKHILQMSTFQMCIVLAFNKKCRFSFEELKKATDLPEVELANNLKSLCYGDRSQRVLLKEPSEKAFAPSDIFSINEAFTSKHNRIKMQAAAASRTESESEKSEGKGMTIDEGRRYEVDAMIVKIMKNKKKLLSSLLLANVMDNLKSRFPLKAAFVTKRIDALIEKEYLVRGKADKNIIFYYTGDALPGMNLPGASSAASSVGPSAVPPASGSSVVSPRGNEFTPNPLSPRRGTPRKGGKRKSKKSKEKK